MAARKSEVLQGTLDLMVFKTLPGLGPLHGFGIAQRIAQRNVLQMNEDTVYASLLPLQQRGSRRDGASRERTIAKQSRTPSLSAAPNSRHARQKPGSESRGDRSCAEDCLRWLKQWLPG